MIGGLVQILFFQGLGELVSKLVVPLIPGPVIGLILLLPLLQWQGVREPVSAIAEFLLAHLSLLFVPVGVGVITHLDVVSAHGAALLLVIVLSTWIGMTTTALVLRWLLRSEANDG